MSTNATIKLVVAFTLITSIFGCRMIENALVMKYWLDDYRECQKANEEYRKALAESRPADIKTPLPSRR